MRIRDIRKNNKILPGKCPHTGIEVMGIAGVVFKKSECGKEYDIFVVDATDPAVEEVGFVISSYDCFHFVTQDGDIFQINGYWGACRPSASATIDHGNYAQEGMFAGEREEMLAAIKEWSDNEHADT